MRVGYDIDGVIIRKAKKGERPPEGLLPDKYDFVISGRSFHRAFETVIELSDLMIYAPVYLNPREPKDVNPQSSGEWKALMIGVLGIEKYYEDDPFQIEIIKNLCPTVEVVLVQ